MSLGNSPWPPPLTRRKLVRILAVRWLMTALLIVIFGFSVIPFTRGSFTTRDWFWFGGLAILLLVNIGLSIWLTRNTLRRWRQQQSAEVDDG